MLEEVENKNLTKLKKRNRTQFIVVINQICQTGQNYVTGNMHLVNYKIINFIIMSSEIRDCLKGNHIYT